MYSVLLTKRVETNLQIPRFSVEEHLDQGSWVVLFSHAIHHMRVEEQLNTLSSYLQQRGVGGSYGSLHFPNGLRLDVPVNERSKPNRRRRKSVLRGEESSGPAFLDE